MKKLLTLLLAILPCITMAQNLVFNGSFEQYSTCPASLGGVPFCNGWASYTFTSPDYFNSCNTGVAGVPNNVVGNQLAAHGNAYMGGYSFSSSTTTTGTVKEYIVGSLTTPMTIGVSYEVSLSVNLPDNVAWATDDFGILFIQNGPLFQNTSTVPVVTPQVTYGSYGTIIDKTNWVRLSAFFTADSAYTHLVAGSWKQSAFANNINVGVGQNICYYYYDSIVVTPAINFMYPDTLLCAGDSIHVPYTTRLKFGTGNVFTLELSGASGSFASPVSIGSLAADTSGTIHGKLPIAVSGTGYRIRIKSSVSSVVSANNGKNIRIKPLPIPLASVNTPVCVGTQLNFTTNALGGSTYLWTGPNSFTSTLANHNIPGSTVAHSGNYIVTTTLDGCTASDTLTVVVNPLPSVPVITTTTPICETDTLKLIGTSNTPGVSYNWSGPSFTSTQQNPVIPSASTGNSGLYTLTTVLNGCQSQQTVTILVKPQPAAANASSNSPVCAVGALLLNAYSPTPGISYEWKGPGSYTATQQNPVIDPSAITHAGNYEVKTILNGCASAGVITTVVINNVTYLGAYASPNDTICEGKTLTMVTVPINGGVNPSFQWYDKNGTIPGATSLTYSLATVATGDSFYCRMIATGVCNTPVTLFSNKIGITTLPKAPSPAVTISSVPANPLPGNAVTFTAIVTNGGTNPQYQWLRNGQNIVGAINNIWSASNLHPNDIISVKVTSANPCPADSFATSNTVEVRFPTSVNGDGNNSGFYLYPNPNNGTFTLDGNMTASAEAEIWNELGQIVYTEALQPLNGVLHHTITLNKTIAPGVYLLRLKTNTESQMMRFTISK